MLGKLLKYDFKSSSREFFGILAAVVLAALFLCCTALLKDTFFAAVIPLLIAALVIASVVLGIMGIFNLYHKRIFTDEGYLTCALPVKTWQMILSKIIVTAVWALSLFAVILLAIGGSVVFLLHAMGFWDAVSPQLMELVEVLNTPVFYLTILAAFVQFLNTIVSIYLATTCAHLRLFRKFKILAGIGAFYAISMVEGALVAAPLLLFPNFFKTFESIDFSNYQNVFLIIGLGALLLNLFFGVVSYFITNHLLQKHLELE